MGMWSVNLDRHRNRLDPATKPVDSNKAENVEDGELHQEERVERSKQVLDSFNDYSKGLDLIQQGKDSQKSDENDQLKQFDTVIEVQVISIWGEVVAHGEETDQLWNSLRGASETVLVGVEDSESIPLTDKFEQEEDVYNDFNCNPCV